MYKFILILFLIFLYGTPVHSQSLQVLEVKDDFKEVLLFDKNTGQEYLAKQGEKVGDWRVVEITQSHVTISRLEGNTVFVTTINFPVIQRMIIEGPRRKLGKTADFR